VGGAIAFVLLKVLGVGLPDIVFIIVPIVISIFGYVLGYVVRFDNFRESY
jgi:hypothetical protein